MTEAEIEDRINQPNKYNIANIHLLRAGGQLPVNQQVGPTCGIYALEAALQIQGRMIAPRKQVFGDWRTQAIPRTESIRVMGPEYLESGPCPISISEGRKRGIRLANTRLA